MEKVDRLEERVVRYLDNLRPRHDVTVEKIINGELMGVLEIRDESDGKGPRIICWDEKKLSFGGVNLAEPTLSVLQSLHLPQPTATIKLQQKLGKEYFNALLEVIRQEISNQI